MTYKVAFIGASGHWGYVTEGMQQLPNTEFTAYAPSFDGEDVSAFASMTINGRKAEAFTDYVKMLDTVKPDIVSITPRYDLIAPIAIECVKRGIHVVLEKPVALNLEDLAALEAAVKTAGVRLYPMFGIRYEPAFYTAKKLMEQGAIGEPALIWGQKSYRWGTGRPDWYRNPKTYGSTIAWVGIHTLDWARWLTGLEYTEIFGYHGTMVHVDYEPCQDNATLVARMSNGATASFNFDYLRPETAVTHGDDKIKIAGSKGVIEIIGREGRIHLINEAGDQENVPLQTPPQFMVDFIQSLEGKHQPLIAMEDAFRVTEVALKATQAAETHQIVKL